MAELRCRSLLRLNLHESVYTGRRKRRRRVYKHHLRPGVHFLGGRIAVHHRHIRIQIGLSRFLSVRVFLLLLRGLLGLRAEIIRSCVNAHHGRAQRLSLLLGLLPLRILFTDAVRVILVFQFIKISHVSPFGF